MEFEFVLKQLLLGFSQNKIRYATAGAFALGALGAERSTKDLDFLVHRDDLDRLHALMTDLKFKRILLSEDMTQYSGETVVWGYVDFIHAFRPLALRMLEEAVILPVFGGTQQLRVLRPEDVVGLKVQAIANDPKREDKDGADILALVLANKNNVDWSRIEEYYRLFGFQARFGKLREKILDA